MSASALHIPTQKTAAQAQQALQALRALPGRRGPRQLRVESKAGQSIDATVPREAFDLFMEILGQLASGHAVTIVPVHAELTTQQAADMLNLSRPYLVRMLENNQLPYTRVGTHRRIRAQDVMTYKAQREAEHESALDELAAEAQKLGLGY